MRVVSIAMCVKIYQYWTTLYPFSYVQILNSSHNLFVISLFDVVQEIQISYIENLARDLLFIHILPIVIDAPGKSLDGPFGSTEPHLL